HLDARKRPGEHQVIEAAKMPDAEELAGDFRQARTERQVESRERLPSELVRIVTVGHQYGRQRVAAVLGDGAPHLEPPRVDRTARRLRMASVPREHGIESLLEQH